MERIISDRILLYLFENGRSGDWVDLATEFREDIIVVKENSLQLSSKRLIELEPVFQGVSIIDMPTGGISGWHQSAKHFRAKITFDGELYVKEKLLNNQDPPFLPPLKRSWSNRLGLRITTIIRIIETHWITKVIVLIGALYTLFQIFA